jgi:hypothetical protein
MTMAKLKEISCFIGMAYGNETSCKNIKDSIISLVHVSYSLSTRKIVENEENVGINTILEVLEM